MKVRKRNNVYMYDVNITNLQGVTKRVRKSGFKTKKEATAAMLEAMNEDSYKINTNITISELSIDYLKFKEQRLSEVSMIKLKTVLNKHILPYLGLLKLCDLNVKHILNFQNTLINDGRTIKTVNYATSSVSSLLKFAQVHYGLERNVANLVGHLREEEEKKKIDFYTKEEFDQFISVVDDVIYKAFFTTLYYCGFRRGEALALNWNDIDFENETIDINKSVTSKIKGIEWKITKTKNASSNRIIKAPKIVLQRLKELNEYYMQYKNYDSKWFVFGAVDPITATSIERKKNTYCKNANVKQIRVHDFRHSHASFLINNGVNILVVSERLGHSNTEMTLNTYSHMFKKQEDEAVDLINSITTSV